MPICSCKVFIILAGFYWILKYLDRFWKTFKYRLS